MASFIDKVDYVIAGMEVCVYQSGELGKAVAVLFLLHGRQNRKEELDALARKLVDSQKGRLRLLVVTLDQRNHGSRIVDDVANNSWSESPSNIRHGIDMYATQWGTAQDVSTLIDFLPSYLFPHGDVAVEKWGVAGISLGGHSTWLLLAHDPRIQVGVAIIGCPDYLALMRHRAAKNGIAIDAPHFPKSLLEFIEKTDPVNHQRAFLGKKILVLSGGSDPVVPWSASAAFVDSLDVGPSGVKTVKVYSGVGHKCTAAMEDELCGFVDRCLLT